MIIKISLLDKSLITNITLIRLFSRMKSHMYFYITNSLGAYSFNTTSPQIFFDNQHIGGYDEIRTLEKENKLQAMLK